jgi:hypothetical protein
MREYAVILIQLMIWSGYSLMVWLSQHDQPLYNWLMFMVFLYLGFILGDTILRSARKTVLLTLFSVLLYAVVQFSLAILNT